ncbi:MAG: GNAT family N-acetyltransferase [Acidobacteriota bacterium]|nr:GNAT family N-acetyltransferase [Acidobacteriota bacterium]
MLASEKNAAAVYTIDPVTDGRWERLVAAHPRGGVFHGCGWLRALQQTYGYRPLALTTTPPNEALRNGIVLCEVDSWLTGRRLVSLPFSDHCDPLLDTAENGEVLLAALRDRLAKRRLRYIELRPHMEFDAMEQQEQMHSGKSFALHVVALERPLEELYRSLHKSCIQSKIARAGREGLHYEEGHSRELIEKFFGLMLLTRKRHGVPPQPIAWFHALARNLGSAMSVHLALKDGVPVAALLTMDCKETVTYKYGCSDERYAALGGTPFLFWKVFERAKEKGMRALDLGRTDLDNPGLLDFKRRLGGVMQQLTYFRFCEHAPEAVKQPSRLAPLVHRAVEMAPQSLLVLAGRILYRHAG